MNYTVDSSRGASPSFNVVSYMMVLVMAVVMMLALLSMLSILAILLAIRSHPCRDLSEDLLQPHLVAW